MREIDKMILLSFVVAVNEERISMDKLQDEIDDVTKVMNEHARLLEKRYDTSQELILAAEILNDRSRQFSLSTKGNNQRMTWKSKTRTNRLILSLTIIFIVIILIVFMAIISRN